MKGGSRLKTIRSSGTIRIRARVQGVRDGSTAHMSFGVNHDACHGSLSRTRMGSSFGTGHSNGALSIGVRDM